jgi:murein DD-endopeptidase MepM/ murein hydrolase activator NlpD
MFFLNKLKISLVLFLINLQFIFSVYSHQLELTKKEIEINSYYKINSLNDDPQLKQLREEIKSHLRQELPIDFKIYEYNIQNKEDFYYIMAKTYQDHSTLLSLNRILNQLTIEDFKFNTTIFIPNSRGLFSEKPIENHPKFIKIRLKYSNKTIYFYPHLKEFSLYHNDYQKQSNKFLFPISFYSKINKNIVTSHYGWRIDPITGKKEFHKGVDIKAEYNTPIYAPIDGIIIFSGEKKGYGNTIILRNKNEKFLFAHLSRLNVKVKDRVKQGDLLGYTGSSGKSTGPHLHLEYIKNSKYENPLTLFEEIF